MKKRRKGSIHQKSFIIYNIVQREYDTKKGHIFCDLFVGVQAGARTQDPILKRDVLYLLSYLNIHCFGLQKQDKYRYARSFPGFFLSFYVYMPDYQVINFYFFFYFQGDPDHKKRVTLQGIILIVWSLGRFVKNGD